MPRFEKEQRFDGFDPDGPYQMVPVGDSRDELSVISGNEEIFIEFDIPGVARFGQLVWDPPGSHRGRATAERAPVGANARLNFEVIGVSRGITNLVVKNSTGSPVVDPKTKQPISLLVSVKDELSKTYSVIKIFDMVRQCPWPSVGPFPISQTVKNVEQVFCAKQIFLYLINLDFL